MNSQHNSLQHDDIRTMPLLDALVKAVEKEQTDKDNDKKEKTIAEMAKDLLSEDDNAKKDPIAIIAEHIKRLYATDLVQQAYAQSSLRSYNSATAYGQQNAVKDNSQMHLDGYDESKIGSSEAQNNGATRLVDENSAAYRLSAGSKVQAFIMTDPKGRIHSTWNIIRVVNESAEGYITQNDGLHYQGL